ncbi:MAG: hypothetical protein JJ992_06050 [Planctomycetes bacterium]|nr:hypothetical protein [Planctomycetota bacterium]
MMVNLSGQSLENPQWSAGGGALQSLLVGGAARAPRFGGSGPETLTSLEADAVYVMLVRETTQDFSIRVDASGVAVEDTLATLEDGQVAFLTGSGLSLPAPVPGVGISLPTPSGGGVAIQADRFTVTFENGASSTSGIASLAVQTGDGTDVVSQVRPANVALTSISTGDGGDFVTLLSIAGTTTVDTAGGEDEVELRAGGPGSELTVVTGADSDVIRVRRTGSGATTSIDTGPAADVVEVSGLSLGSAVSVNCQTGDADCVPQPIEDTLYFDSGSKAMVRTRSASAATAICPATSRCRSSWLATETGTAWWKSPT